VVVVMPWQIEVGVLLCTGIVNAVREADRYV
jgi:hypothetical protein